MSIFKELPDQALVNELVKRMVDENNELLAENKKLRENLDFLEAMNGRLEEARVAHLGTSEKYQAKNKRLREALEEIISYGNSMVFSDGKSIFQIAVETLTEVDGE